MKNRNENPHNIHTHRIKDSAENFKKVSKYEDRHLKKAEGENSRNIIIVSKT